MNEYYISVVFEKNPKSYYFSLNDKNLVKKGDFVVVENVIGKELAKAVTDPKDINEIDFDLEIKPILRLATEEDIKQHEENEKHAKEAWTIFNDAVEELELDMRLLDVMYTLDRQKCLFTYASDERIDFRELLKILASQLHCRIELRQVSSRERAKIVGGLGICGLPLCCSFFSSGFDSISLNRAKNQMLAINIPKLSGQCGKLMCCLKYEDDNYTELKKEFPPLNSTVKYQGAEYTVTSYNLFSREVKIENSENTETVSLDELLHKAGSEKKKQKETSTIVKLTEQEPTPEDKKQHKNRNNNKFKQNRNKKHDKK